VVAQRSERNITLLISQTIMTAAVADFSGGKTSDESLTARRVTPTAARASAFMFFRRGTIEDTDVNLSTAVLCEETEQVAKRSTGVVEQPSLPAGMAS
jgi:hypothetical protein